MKPEEVIVAEIEEEEVLEELESGGRKREWLRLLWIALGAGVLVLILHFTPMKELLVRAQGWKAAAAAMGWKASVGFVVARGSERLRAILKQPGVMAIFVARQMPFPGIVPNVLLGVLDTRHRKFLLGTFLGYLPSNLPVALAGSSLGKDSLERAMSQVTLSMIALGLGSALMMWLRNRWRSKRAK